MVAKKIINRLKKKPTTVEALAAAIVLFIILGAGSWFAHVQISAHNAAMREAALAQQKRLSNDTAFELNRLQGDNKSGHTSKVAQNSSSSESSYSEPKYSVSPDPRSTAYSTTPPKPNPASFNIKITRPGQVPTGTLISYNATKGDRTYYGGDLILTPSTVVLSKSTNRTPSFSVSLPDGHLTEGAGLPWDEQDQVAFVAFQGTSTPSAAISISQIVQLFSNSTPNGTYRIHISSGASDPASSDGLEYDGFLTLIVTD